MIVPILFAFSVGLLIILSRQVNGRLSLSSTAMISSFWNHFVGFVVITLLGLAIGGLIPPNIGEIPWWVFTGGAIGVVFVASGSWLITRIGAVNSTLLVMAGQMVTGVVFDFLRGASVNLLASTLGIVLIFAGMALTQRKG
ncbi:transporter family-2 protein [Devosia lucknowensis]|uniref:Transporter family-2 protein n=1 Tax=Devosia lucknowensis TaxID=1096929 RepID=A0A1Y6F6K6_9HYPH|nr:DMT family transporter [Devosia lucknowensis]SMQ70189.1 transporter family-2 protein [Devosia lucknowensis]